MKLQLVALVSTLGLSISHLVTAAEPIYPATKLTFDKLPFKSVAQKNLPKGVFFSINEGIEQNEDPEFAGPICYYDLNNDGKKEVIVQSDASRTNRYVIWQSRKGRWIWILSVEGNTSLLERKNGYFQISVQNEDRRENGSREFYTYEGERYHLVRRDRYRAGKFVESDKVTEDDARLEKEYRELNLTEAEWEKAHQERLRK